MSTTAQQLIEAAYSRSTANDPGKLATDGELLGVGNRLYKGLFAVAAAAAPERFLSLISLTLSGSPPQAQLPFDVIDIRRVQRVTGQKVNVIPVEEVDRSWHLAPAVYREGLFLKSRGQTGDPVGSDVLSAWILDAPADLTALTSTLDSRFPAQHHELIVVEMAIYLATKDSGRNATEFQSLFKYRDQQYEAFLRLSGLSMTALQSPHGGVIVQRLQSLIQAGASQPQG